MMQSANISAPPIVDAFERIVRPAASTLATVATFIPAGNAEASREMDQLVHDYWATKPRRIIKRATEDK